MSYCWKKTRVGWGFPPNAVKGGIDSDGHAIFVGRALHNGQWVPAKIIPGKNAAYIAYGGQEHLKTNYEVLCQPHFDWVSTSGSSIPPGAVEGGTDGCETLFIGRVIYNGSQTVGKVHRSHGVCYISYDGKEIPFKNYEILVLHH